MSDQRVAIVAGARTPFVKARTAFAELGPLKLAKHAVTGLLERHRHAAREISGELFWKTVGAGLIATYVMTMTGFWQSGLGIPAIDVGAMIADSMTAAHPDAPYTLVGGNLVHFANGVILALIWVAFLQKGVPGNWIEQGLVYALMTQLAAWVVVAPLAFGVGLFFTSTPAPGQMMLATAVTHVAYGLSLTLSLQAAGVRGMSSQNPRAIPFVDSCPQALPARITRSAPSHSA